MLNIFIKLDPDRFLNILLITKNYPPSICGVGDHSFHLKNEWEKMGHEVWIFTTGKKSEVARVINYIENEFSVAITSQLQAIINRHKIDHLFWQYVPYSFQPKGLPAWLPAVMQRLKETGVQQAVFFHEVSLRLSGDGIRQSMAAFLQRRIANRMARIADHIFTSIPLYRGYFNGVKPILVPVGSNLPLLVTSTGVQEHRVICFTNRADEALLTAVLSLRRSLPVSLCLCGAVNASQQKKLEDWALVNEAAAWMDITGELSPEDLANCMARAAIFIQPQVTDPKGRGGISAKNGTIMAAMSMGKPIITCAGDMTDDQLFKNGENMLFVPYGNAVAYQEALLQLLQDKTLAQKLGDNAAATYRQHCSWTRIASQLLPGAPYNRMQSLPQP